MDKQEKLVEALLRGALGVIRDRRHWAKGSLARAGRMEVDPLDERAERWCAVGALNLTAHRMGLNCSYQYSNPEDGGPYMEALSRLCVLARTPRHGNHQSVEAVNDYLGHANVVQLFEDALGEAE